MLCVAQTGRHFLTRYKEHLYSFRKNNFKSSFAQHILDNDLTTEPINTTVKTSRTRNSMCYKNFVFWENPKQAPITTHDHLYQDLRHVTQFTTLRYPPAAHSTSSKTPGCKREQNNSKFTNLASTEVGTNIYTVTNVTNPLYITFSFSYLCF